MVGIFFIVATVAGVLGLVVLDPILNAPDDLVNVASHETRLIVGALFALIMAIACAGIPIAAYPVIKKHNETLAIGFVVFRAGLEAVSHLAVVVSMLLVLPLSQIYLQAGTSAASHLPAFGRLLLETNEISAIGSIVFCLGAMMFYYVLYQAKLVPRWLSAWGLLAAILYLAEGVLSMSSLIGSMSIIGVALDLPLALQEMVLAVWLIVKGFESSSDSETAVKPISMRPARA